MGSILTLFQPKIISDDLKEDSVSKKLRGVLLKYRKNIEKEDIEKMMDKILEIRQNARSKKDWNTSDKIRNELEQIGFEIEDTNDGPIWRKKLNL